MSTILTVPRIKFVMNLIIIVILLNGASIVLKKSYTLLFKPQDIELIRLEIPWTRPVQDVTIMLHEHILAENPDIRRTVSTNIFIHDLIERICLITLIILLLVQIRKLLIAINQGTFFKPENLRIVRNLSLLVGIWVFVNFILYQMISLFIPTELMYERINFTTLGESVFHSLMSSIDFKMLFVAIVLYVITISFREGYSLKEQADLTI